MRACIILCLFISLTINASKLFARDLPFFKYIKDESVRDKIRDIENKVSDSKLKNIFKKKNLNCELNVIKKLLFLDRDEVKYAVYRAMAKGFISDIERDIFLEITKTLESINRPKQQLNLNFSSGKDFIHNFYQKTLTDDSLCVEESWNQLKQTIVFNNQESEFDYFNELNIYALRKRMISYSDYVFLETVRKTTMQNRLTIRSYRKKVKSLKGFDFEINNQLTTIHSKNTKTSNIGLRYHLYSKYSIYQMNEMAELIRKMVKRTMANKTFFIMVDENNNIFEKNKLSVMEQYHYALKMFSIEKEKVLNSEAFKGSRLKFIDLLIVAFEFKYIDKYELEGLYDLIEKTNERTLAMKSLDFTKKYQFIISTISPPLVDILFNFAVGIFSFYIEKPEVEKDYSHDLFYGNCKKKL